MYDRGRMIKKDNDHSSAPNAANGSENKTAEGSGNS